MRDTGPMPDAEAPTGQRPTDATAVAGLPDLDPVPRTGSSAPAARRPYAESRGDAGSGPAGWGPPAGPAPWPDPTADGAGPTVARPAPPDAPPTAPAPPTGPPTGPAPVDGGYRPGEPLKRPLSASRPDADVHPARRAAAGPVPAAVQDAARRAGRVALVLAVAGVALTIVFFPVGALLDLAAVALGIRAVVLARRARVPAAPGGTAIGLGAVAALVAVVLGVVLGIFWTEARSFMSCSREAMTTTARDACTAGLRNDLQRRVDGWSR